MIANMCSIVKSPDYLRASSLPGLAARLHGSDGSRRRNPNGTATAAAGEHAGPLVAAALPWPLTGSA